VNYISVCSGIEAATVAWHPLGWRPLLFAETARFPSRVLAHHYPEVVNVGDFTTITKRFDCDLLVGGTPCQAFSVAGHRRGMGDPRGNLALEFLRLVDRLRPRWVVWENVPGILSSGGGRDFGAFLGALAELRYGFAYRVLDAQFFGVPQRRRRVFVVGCIGDWRPAGAVLLERASSRGHSPSRRKARKEVAGTLSGGSGDRGWASDTDQMTFNPVFARTLTASAQRLDYETETLLALSAVGSGVDVGSIAPTIRRCNSLAVSSASSARVRRLTPMECERLQGFPDGYTAIPEARDGVRYAALGNSMAVPVMAWLGHRISFVEMCVTGAHESRR